VEGGEKGGVAGWKGVRRKGWKQGKKGRGRKGIPIIKCKLNSEEQKPLRLTFKWPTSSPLRSSGSRDPLPR